MEVEGNISQEQASGEANGTGHAVMVAPVHDETGNPLKGDAERNAVFVNLVREDGDIIGLVAYSIYKQNKVDWLHAFQKTLGRGPTDTELAAYIIGESTPRRLSTYRHLAGATLTGNGPDAVADGAWSNNATLRHGEQGKRGPGWIISSVLSYVVLAAAIIVGIWLAARYGVPAVRS
jgi:hypothetical protein